MVVSNIDDDEYYIDIDIDEIASRLLKSVFWRESRGFNKDSEFQIFILFKVHQPLFRLIMFLFDV